MKKSLLTLWSVACSTLLFAQIPNGDFETWTNKGTYDDPNNWSTTNGLTQLGNPPSIFKSIDAHSGTSACEINVVHITTKIPGVFIPDYTGSLFTGSQVGVTSKYGFAYTSKPTKLGFWYKYNARNADTATFVVLTTKWNTTTNSRDTISIGYGLFKDSVGVYTKGEVMLYAYDSINSPDSAVIIISASTIFATQAGAKLVLDDMAFEGGNVGVKEISKYSFSMYPNPATHLGIELILQESADDIEVCIMDMKGTQLYRSTAQKQSHLFVPTEYLSSGFYLLKVTTTNGSAINKLLIQ